MKVIEYERYEPETTAWISQFKKIKKQKIFWDIGAQIGLHSIFAATKFKNIKVISFEPSTSNLRILSRNISINSLSNKINIISLPISEKLKISYLKKQNSLTQANLLLKIITIKVNNLKIEI